MCRLQFQLLTWRLPSSHGASPCAPSFHFSPSLASPFVPVWTPWHHGLLERFFQAAKHSPRCLPPCTSWTSFSPCSSTKTQPRPRPRLQSHLSSFSPSCLCSPSLSFASRLPHR